MKRKHKTLYQARKALKEAKENSTTIFPDYDNYNIYRIKNATIWKYWIGSELEWIHGLYR